MAEPIKSKTLPTTSYTGESSKSFVVGAGALVTDLSYDKESKEYSYKKLGATSGGSTISLKTTTRQMEIDGILSTPVGADMIETSEATIQANLLEHTLENYAMAVIGEEKSDTEGKYGETGTKIVRPVARIRQKHYIKDLAHISPLSDGGFLIVKFDYAIVTEGAESNPQDGADNLLNVTFSARTSPDNLQDAALPVTIIRVPGNQTDAEV